MVSTTPLQGSEPAAQVAGWRSTSRESGGSGACIWAARDVPKSIHESMGAGVIDQRVGPSATVAATAAKIDWTDHNPEARHRKASASSLEIGVSLSRSTSGSGRRHRLRTPGSPTRVGQIFQRSETPEPEDSLILGNGGSAVITLGQFEGDSVLHAQPLSDRWQLSIRNRLKDGSPRS